MIQRSPTGASRATSALSFSVELGLVEPGLGDVEVEPAVALADGAAGDRVGQHHAQEMERGVDPHPA